MNRKKPGAISGAEQQAALLEIELRFLLDRARTDFLQHDIVLPQYAQDKSFASSEQAARVLALARTRLSGRNSLPLARVSSEPEVYAAVAQRIAEVCRHVRVAVCFTFIAAGKRGASPAAHRVWHRNARPRSASRLDRLRARV